MVQCNGFGPAAHTLVLQHGEAYRRVRTHGVREPDGTLTPTDLTGFEYVCEIRESSVEGSPLLLRIASDNALVVLGGVAGTITYAVDVATVLTVPVGDWWHDEALVQPNGEPVYVDRGPVSVLARVSVVTS